MWKDHLSRRPLRPRVQPVKYASSEWGRLGLVYFFPGFLRGSFFVSCFLVCAAQVSHISPFLLKSKDFIPRKKALQNGSRLPALPPVSQIRAISAAEVPLQLSKMSLTPPYYVLATGDYPWNAQSIAKHATLLLNSGRGDSANLQSIHGTAIRLSPHIKKSPLVPRRLPLSTLLTVRRLTSVR